MTIFDEPSVRAAFDCDDVLYLGHGTFGETWKLVDVDVAGRRGDVAAKILRPEHFNHALVLRETRGLNVLETDSAVKLLEVREVQIGGTLHTVLVCEFIEGGSAEQNLRVAPPTIEEVIAFATALVSTVELLHAEDVIHRDIKLANVILRDGDWASPVLIDFGLSRGLSDDTFTAYPQPVGTIAYMAPEQLRGERARKAADLWAIGVAIYVLIAGRHPYYDSLSGLLLDDIVDLVTGPPRPLPEGTPEALDVLVTRLLSDETYQRGSAKRTRADLEELTDRG